MDNETLGAALARMKSMPDTAASSAAAAEASAEAAAASAQEAQEYADSIDSITTQELLEYLELDEPRESFRRVVAVSGTEPVITGETNYQYICGEVTSISITPPEEGIVDVLFQSGATATVMTVPASVVWPVWFDPEHLEANRTYEINILNGVYGVVAVWA